MQITQSGARHLVHIPIIHSREDMGSLGRNLPTARSYPRKAEDFWARVEKTVKNLQLDWYRVKIYQDGLPDTTPELVRKIVEEVKSPNYDLLRWMITQGATIMGTESPRLLAEEYMMLKAIVDSKDQAAKIKATELYGRRAPGLLEERDAYMAKRIDETLQPGETGVLLVGLAHKVEEKLCPDIDVSQLPQSP